MNHDEPQEAETMEMDHGMSPEERLEFAELLLQLAKHYSREALLEHEMKNKWLQDFKYPQPALKGARTHFFEDCSGCISVLEEYTKLVSLAAGNEVLTLKCGVIFVQFIVEIYDFVEKGL